MEIKRENSDIKRANCAIEEFIAQNEGTIKDIYDKIDFQHFTFEKLIN